MGMNLTRLYLWGLALCASMAVATGAASGNGFGVTEAVNSGDPPASTWNPLSQNLLFSVTSTSSPTNIYVVAAGSHGLDGDISLENHVVHQIGFGSWTQTTSYTGVTIQAVVGDALSEGATGVAYLSTSIGAGATVLYTSATFNFPNANTGTVTLFSGLSLGPGTYYLVLSGNFDNSGAYWPSSSNAVVTADPGGAPTTPVPPSLWLTIAGCVTLLGYALWTWRRLA